MARDPLAEHHRSSSSATCTPAGACSSPRRRRRVTEGDLELADAIERTFMTRFGEVPVVAAVQLAAMRGRV